eukprot:Em0005g436a
MGEESLSSVLLLLRTMLEERKQAAGGKEIRWIPNDMGPEYSVDQLVLPFQCRKAVLQLAHEVPIAGHLGKQKTSRRIMQRFYWPSLYRDVADFCKCCQICQKVSRNKAVHAPLIPLPVVTEPFRRVAMDIVGPLPRTKSGNRYILVLCDYGTRYPEAVEVRSIDAECVADELVPQASTGFSPFELLYGRAVSGPLDIVKGAGEGSKSTKDSVVSYVLGVQNKLSKMAALAAEHLREAQVDQKRWERTFHVNMLKKWNTAAENVHFAAERDEGEETEEEDIPEWRGGGVGEPKMGVQLSESQKVQIRELLDEFWEVMSGTPGRTFKAVHNVQLTDRKPVRLAPYRLPHAYRELVRKEINEMLEAGVIEPSNSEWAAPIVLVDKKDGTTQMCVDYRRLNAVSLSDAYPMPRGSSVAYIDDVAIFSNSWEEHLQHVRVVLQRIQEAGLTAKPQKCQFGMDQCLYQGHIVGNGVVRPERSKLQGVESFPTPCTKTQVQCFLGLTGYYRKFIPNYADIAAPLTDLTKKSAPSKVEWSQECGKGIQTAEDTVVL